MVLAPRLLLSLNTIYFIHKKKRKKKKRKDYEEAFEENTWRLLSEVSLSEERFQEVNALIFEVIACVDNVSKATFLISISNEMKLILLNFAKF